MLYVLSIISAIFLVVGSVGPNGLEASSKSKSSSKSKVPSELKKIGYFETIESEVYEDADAVQLNSYYYDQNGTMKNYLFVWTLLKTATGSYEGSPEGEQEIYYDKKVISKSRKITYTTINGEPTIQHWHKHFCVQTNRFEQTLTYLEKSPL
jgi:hypothetical protein